MRVPHSDGAAQSFGDLGIEGTVADGDGTTDSVVRSQSKTSL